jgi:hypothetical protein
VYLSLNDFGIFLLASPIISRLLENARIKVSLVEKSLKDRFSEVDRI